jgi:hypothetical protein
MKKSEFEAWFVMQFGKCPMSNAKSLILEGKLRVLEMEAGIIKREIRELQDWHSNERAARYAWNARGNP